jgi:hypothetical protein
LCVYRKNDFTDASARVLADYLSASKTLQALSLGHNSIGDATLTALSEALSRRPLDAAATVAARKQIEEAKRKKGPPEPSPFEEVGGALFAAGNRSLTWLELAHTHVTTTGLRTLLSAAEMNTNICAVLLENTPAVAEPSEEHQRLTQMLSDRNVVSTHRTGGSIKTAS